MSPKILFLRYTSRADRSLNLRDQQSLKRTTGIQKVSLKLMTLL